MSFFFALLQGGENPVDSNEADQMVDDDELATPSSGLMAFGFRSPLIFLGFGSPSSGKRAIRTDPVTPPPKVRVVPQDDKPVHQLLEAQVQEISALEEQIRANDEMIQHMKDCHELVAQYAKMMEGVQAQQATLQEQPNENAKHIRAEADEHLLQTRKPGIGSRIGSSSAEMSEQGFAQAESNATDSAPPRHHDNPQMDGDPRMGAGNVEASGNSVSQRQRTQHPVPPRVRFQPPKGGANPRLQIDSRRTAESSFHAPDISPPRTRQATPDILQSDLRRNPPVQARPHIRNTTMSGIPESSRLRQPPPGATTPTRPRVTPPSASASLQPRSSNATPMSGIIHQSGSSAATPTRPLLTPSSFSASSRARSIISCSSRTVTPMSDFSEISRVRQSASSVTTRTRLRSGAFTPSDDHNDGDGEGTHAQLEKKLDQLIQEFCQIQCDGQSSRRNETSGKFKPASGPCRVKDKRRTDLLRIVRTAMNTAMGIEHDKDIIAAELASAEEVEEYEIEEDDAPAQPTLDPMRPFLPRAESSWNKQLWSLLVANFPKIHKLDADTIAEMERAFYDRLKRLHRIYKSDVPKDGENYEEFEEHRKQKAQKTLRRQRAHSRRGTLFQARQTITELNKSAGRTDEVWEALDFVVGTLSRGGTSSDESETDTSGQKQYFVKNMSWRSKEVTHLLRIVDDNRNTSNGVGGRRSRKRTVRRPGSVTARNAPSGLPFNFYDLAWYNDLSESDKRALNVQPTVELPTIDH